MPTTIVVGAQWGDEGKGKVIDALADSHDAGVRYGGGANAGHTVEFGDERMVLHLVPSTIVQGKLSIIGNGVVLDPASLVEEMGMLAGKGIDTEKLHISDKALLILDQDKALEAALESARGAGRIGTTKRGIGPAYAGHRLRSGARVCDVVDRHGNIDRDGLWRVLAADPYFEILERTYGTRVDRKDVLEKCVASAERFRGNVRRTDYEISEMIKQGKFVLFEGAQGTYLDIDHGTYPYVTSSTTTAAGAQSGSGVAFRPDRVIGVVKAYTTRVGEGPFPTEFASESEVASEFPSGDELKQMGLKIDQWEMKNYNRLATLDSIWHGNRLSLSRFFRVEGGEYGATTGRPRRGGWPDLVMLRQSARVNGFTEIAITKADVMCDLDFIEACDRYLLDGDTLFDEVPSREADLARCRPKYARRVGWGGGMSQAKSWEELPPNFRGYIGDVADAAGAPVTIISTGPKRHQTIYRAKA
jgi:adenylosuccinate synthase